MYKRYVATFLLVALLFAQALASTTTSNPTSNQSPDATLGGLTVTTPTNTGHASTVTSASGAGGQQERSCRWFNFQSVSGSITAITLKIDHTSSGTLSGGSSNLFLLEYSLNGGGSWTTAVSRNNFTSAQGPTTFSVGLSAAQDISQVQVRVDYLTDSNEVGDSTSITATIANIKLEVTRLDQARPIIMM
jgi:hypothetical protein